MKVSFLIPTNKPTHFLQAVANSIVAARENSAHDFELLVYSKSYPQIEGDFELTWVQESDITIPHSYNVMARYATGDYCFYSADDFGFEPNFFKMVDQAELRNDKIVLAPEHRGHPHYPIRHGTCPILGCGLIHKDVIKNDLDGYIFSPIFKYHYCDVFLSFYLDFIGKTGEVVTYTGLRKLINHPTHTTHDGHDEYWYDLMVREFREGKRIKYVES